MTRQHHNTRTCPACSKPLERKTRPDGRPETPKQWAERKYCDRRCRDKAMTQAKNAPKTKTCPQCGKRYRQRPGEGPKRFQERRTCSRECAAKTRGHELTNAPPAPKPCEACGTTMRKKPDETPKVFRGRRFCSRKCAATLKKRTGNRTKVARIYEPDPTRVCPACNKPLVRRPTELAHDYNRRTFCDRDCFHASREGVTSNQWTRRPKAAQRSDRDVQFSRAALMPTSIEELGQKREYPRVQPLGEPCPVHPGNTIGAFGCPACNAGQRWADRQRQTVIRPHHEGGR